jgi:hypothetical protein
MTTLRVLLVLLLGCLVLPGQTLPLPPRPADAGSGSQLAGLLERMPRAERENWLFNEVLRGNVPTWLRALVPITYSETVQGVAYTTTFHVTPDYLAVGSDQDYLLAPMTPLLAQRLADRLDCSLPTRKMVNLIWTNAVVKLAPQPIPPSAAMATMPVFADHNVMVRTQRNLSTNTFPLGALVAGDKKDVVISSKIYTNFSRPGITKPVVIYGWHYQSGSPIQPLYNGHEETYADYSHGIRLVRQECVLNGSSARVSSLLTNAATAALLSDETASEGATDSVIERPRYTVPALAPEVLQPPHSSSLAPGADFLLTVQAVGDPPPDFFGNGTARWSTRPTGRSWPSIISPRLRPAIGP